MNTKRSKAGKKDSELRQGQAMSFGFEIEKVFHIGSFWSLAQTEPALKVYMQDIIHY